MNKKLGRFYLKPILRLLVAASIIAFTVTLSQCSCGKTPAAGGSNNSGSGNNGSGDGNATCTGICPTGTLTLTATPNYSKVSGNTVIINANVLAGTVLALSDADDNNRGFDDAEVPTLTYPLFKINYPSATTTLFFVNRTLISTNTITMPATIPVSTMGCSSSESGDEAFATAAGGGSCRVYNAGGIDITLYNYLGTVFNNTDTANRARGLMRCGNTLSSNAAISDTTVFARLNEIECRIAAVNNGLGTGVEIDDTWVTDTRSTTEVELYAIGIDVSGKTVSQFSSAAGYNLAAFITAHDNADFKRLLQNNPWGELKFKVKIVASANF